MRSIILAAITFVPALALAQAPTDPAAPPPPPPGPPAGPPGAPPPTGAPAYSQPVYVQPAAPATPWSTHDGVTFEANLGLGYAHLTDDNSNMTLDTDADVAGLNIGVGGWLSPQLALTGRIAGVDIKYGSGASGTSNIPGGGTLVLAWVGPSLQYWVDPHFWFGGGIGFATYRLVGNSNCGNSSNANNSCGINGYGADIRAGYSFGDSKHTFNVSVELTPTHLSSDNTAGTTVNSGGTATGLAILAGYQYL
jgi:hypothetical protein